MLYEGLTQIADHIERKTYPVATVKTNRTKLKIIFISMWTSKTLGTPLHLALGTRTDQQYLDLMESHQLQSTPFMDLTKQECTPGLNSVSSKTVSVPLLEKPRRKFRKHIVHSYNQIDLGSLQYFAPRTDFFAKNITIPG